MNTSSNARLKKGEGLSLKIGLIPDGWHRYKLYELMEITSSKRIFFSEYISAGIPFYRSKEVIEKFNNKSVSTELFISKERFEDIKQKFGVPQRGDILLTSVGTLGVPFLIEDDTDFYFKDGNLTWFLNFKRDSILSEYLYYWLASNTGRQKLLDSSIGSTQQALTIAGLKNIEIDVPSCEEQHSIAKTLHCIDGKIKLNHRMNETLEGVALVLFKRWFVDFEFPDAKGRPYRSYGGKMVSSELGPVPAGWRVVPLTEMVDVLGGGTPSTGVSSYWDGEIPFFTPKDASEASYVTRTEKTVTQEGLTHCNSPQFPHGTVFITARGTVGKVCMAGVPMAMNQSCYALKGKELRQLYVFFLIKDIAQKLIQQSHGTVFETITTQTFQRTMAIRPEADVVNLFCTKVECLYAQILNNINESASLGTIRDSILPRMMSGKMTVS